MDSANSKIFIVKEVKWTNDCVVRIKKDEINYLDDMILKQKLEKISEDLSLRSDSNLPYRTIIDALNFTPDYCVAL